MTEKSFRMVGVQVRNVMRCVAFDWTASGEPVVRVTGDNGSGKTSILKAIQMALAGGRSVPERVQRDGAEKWRSQVVLQTIDGEETLLVTRSGSGNNNGTLSIATQQGTRISSPQALLDTLISSVALDPLQFLGAHPKQQQAMLMQAAHIEFDELLFEQERKDHYETRTVLNRDAKRLEAEAQAAGSRAEIEALAQQAPPNVDKLLEELGHANRHNAEVEKAEWSRKHLQGEAERLRNKIAEAEKEIEAMKAKLANTEAELSKPEEMVKLPTAELNEKIKNAQQINSRIAASKTALAKWQELDDVKAKADAETAEIEKMDAWKAKPLASAQMPVEGLSFGEEGLLYRGLPLAQASTGEQLTIAIGVAAACHPNLRVIFIDEGSVLDKNNMTRIEQIAKERDLLVWVNSVQAGQPGLLIKEGTVAAGESE